MFGKKKKRGGSNNSSRSRSKPPSQRRPNGRSTASHSAPRGPSSQAPSRQGSSTSSHRSDSTSGHPPGRQGSAKISLGAPKKPPPKHGKPPSSKSKRQEHVKRGLKAGSELASWDLDLEKGGRGGSNSQGSSDGPSGPMDPLFKKLVKCADGAINGPTVCDPCSCCCCCFKCCCKKKSKGGTKSRSKLAITRKDLLKILIPELGDALVVLMSLRDLGRMSHEASKIDKQLGINKGAKGSAAKMARSVAVAFWFNILICLVPVVGGIIGKIINCCFDPISKLEKDIHRLRKARGV